MRPGSSAPDRSVALASGPAAAGIGSGEAAVLPRFTPLGVRLWLPRLRVAAHPLAGRLALATVLLGALTVVVFTTAGPTTLIARSAQTFPGWEAGPLHPLTQGLHVSNGTLLAIGLSAVMIIMAFAYLVVLASVRTMSMRLIVACVLALHAILLLGPPLTLTDVFNYLGYARLGGLHHLNPYTHVIQSELHDPVYRFTTWHHLSSPYGPLFTAASYPLSYLSLATSYWIVKVGTVLASLTFIALVWKCARLLGRDPRFAVAFVAVNPILLMYGLAGFHNDFFMLIASTGAVALVLARRDRTAGAALMIAVAIKFTAVLLLPFLLLAARPARRRLHVLLGAALAAIPLMAMYLALFGMTLPNLQDQSTLLTDWSIPNLFGVVFGLGGGTAALLRVANVVVVVSVALLLRRRGDWLTGAGWSTFALIASLAWLVPWYVMWLLPLAALASSDRLRRVTVAFTMFLVLAFAPYTGRVLSRLGINLLATPAGQTSIALQHKLED